MTWKKIKNEIKKQRDAILAGGFVGLSSAYYLLNIKDVDISMVVGRQGLLDTMMDSTPALMIAKYKIYLVFIVMGSVIGYLIGNYIIKKKR